MFNKKSTEDDRSMKHVENNGEPLILSRVKIF